MQNLSNKRLIAAAIIEKDGKILIAQRGKNDDLYGKWEFPGGKLEEGETLEECLKRELNEEFGIVAKVGTHCCISSFAHNYQQYDMHVFRVTHFQGNIELREHLAIAWITINELDNYNYPAADIPIITFLKKSFFK